VRDAQVVYAHAHRLHPVSRDCFGFFVDSVRRELPRPSLAASGPDMQDPWPQRTIEAEVERINAINRANQQRMTEQLERMAPNTPGSPLGRGRSRP
jgi:hypothetical protein